MVLVGDSAHAPSSSSGQGASLAAESAIELARCLRDLPNLPAAFEVYQRLRRPRVEKIAANAARTNSDKRSGPVAKAMFNIMMFIAMKILTPEKMFGHIHRFQNKLGRTRGLVMSMRKSSVIGMYVKTAALFLLLIAGPGPTLAAWSTPFTVDAGMVKVNASINGAPPGPMLVDLGAGVDVLSGQAARRAHLKTDDVFTGWRMRGDRIDLPIGTITSIAIGPTLVNGPWVTEWDALDGHGVDGLISASQFRNVPVTFDYVHRVLTFEDADSLALRTNGATRVPLLLQDDRGISLGIFARFDFGHGQSGLCEIDTGSQGIFLAKRFAEKFGLAAGIATARLDAIGLYGAPSVDGKPMDVRFGDLIYDCNVGNDFWKGRVFTLDIPHKALYVK
jgi:hypothetical protein